MNGRIEVKTGDITKEQVCAIVNAANSSLYGGGGVDGAIHRAGGKEILEECRTIRKEIYPGGLPTGKAVATGSGKLPSKYVVHTVGPVWRGGADSEEKLLYDAYYNSLLIAREKECSTVAFPAISTGVYGFPKDKAAVIASKAVKTFLKTDDRIEKVIFIFFNEDDMRIFFENAEF